MWNVYQAKELAERKAKEVETVMESLRSELQHEKKVRWSLMTTSNKTSKENAAIKRVIQSLGCKFHLSDNGDCFFDIESDLLGSSQTFTRHYSKRDLDGKSGDDEKDLSVSVDVYEDDADYAVVRICESLCPLGAPNGHCRWPDGGCAQRNNQLVGLRANYDAFDQLSIDDSYFKSE